MSDANTVSTPPITEAETAQLSSIPNDWPGAFGIYKYSKVAVKYNLGTVLIVGLLSILVGGGLDAGLKTPGQSISFILGAFFTAVLTLTYIAGVRRFKISVEEAFRQALPFWVKMILLTLLVTIVTIISFLLLIVPVLFVLPRLTLANYFLVDKNMGVIEAFKASWDATKGHIIQIYGIFGAGLLMAMLMLTIIGIPFAIYFLIMYSAAYAVLYEYIQKKQPVVSA